VAEGLSYRTNVVQGNYNSSNKLQGTKMFHVEHFSERGKWGHFQAESLGNLNRDQGGRDGTRDCDATPFLRRAECDKQESTKLAAEPARATL
jgi:hypothetical protein